MEIYLSEDIVIPNLTYNDNQDVLDLIIKKPKGMIPMLDEEGQVPKGSWEGFLNKFTKQHSGISKRLKYRPGAVEFTIVHYAGDVTYDPSLFITKNKDTLSPDLSEAMATSTCPLLANVFEDASNEPNPTGRASTVASKQTVGTKFRIQLDSLMTTLDATEPRYIRCIKPNALKHARLFEAALTNEQLTYSGVFEAVIIMQNGYPFRLGLREFRNRYHMLALSGTDRNKIFRRGTKACEREHLMALGAVLPRIHDTLQYCHVGKTMVFYRAEQHRCLETVRRERIDHALNVLHRSVRRFIARNLYVSFLMLRQRCTDAVLSKNIEVMRATSTEANLYLRRMRNVHKVDIAQQDCCTVAAGYADALVTQQKQQATIEALLGDSTTNVFAIYDPLRIAVDVAKSLCFEATLQGHTIEVVWHKNDVFVGADRKVQGLKKIIDVQRNLERGLKDNDEIALRIWLDKLRDLRQTGDVEAKFCRDEENTAKQVVKTAQEVFESFLSTAKFAMSAGRLTFELRSPGSPILEDLLDVDLSVDPSPIKEFLHELGSSTSLTKGKSAQKDQLVAIARELCRFREFALTKRWKNVWDDMGKWSNYLCATDEVRELASYDDCFPFVDEVNDIICDEIKCFYVCALGEVYFRQLYAELARDNIPEYLSLDKLTSQTTELENIIDFLNMPNQAANMCAEQRRVLDHAKVKANIRSAVINAQSSLLHENLDAGCTLLPTNDVDLVRGSKWMTFYDTLDELICALRDGGPTGSPGTLHLSSVSVSSLQRCCMVCSGLEVRPRHEWEKVVSAICVIRDIRLSCCDNDLVKADAILRELRMKPENTFIFDSKNRVESQGDGNIFAEVLDLVRKDVELYQKEINHLLALEELFSCSKVGMVSGEVGALRVENVEVVKLKSVLERVTALLILTSEVDGLVSDCLALIALRSLVLEDDWDAILLKTEDMFESSQSFSTIHPLVRPEFEVLYGEAQDLQSRKKMLDSLCVEVLFEGDNGDLIILESAKDQAELRAAIRFSKSQKTLSFEAMSLLSTAELMLLFREVVSHSLWEEPYLGLSGASSGDIAYAILEKFSSSSDNDKTEVLRKLLAPWRRTELPDVDEVFMKSLPPSYFTSLGLNVHSLLCYSQQLDVHECAQDEIALIRRIAVDRQCRIALVLAVSIDKIKGTVEYLDNTTVSVDMLMECISYVVMRQSKLSPLTQRWLAAALDILNFRYAVGDRSSKKSTAVELISYFDLDFLNKCKAFVACSKVVDGGEDDIFGFPVDELKLCVDHTFDCLSIADLAGALHRGRPQFYNGKFDTTNVAYDHLENALAVAKRCENRSDRLDRLMFYAELTYMLRRAIATHRWDLSESGERTYTMEQKRGSGVKQCLLEYQQAGQFFQREMEGIPPRALKEEFLLTQREWERRLILQGFPSAFQSGRIGGANGNIIIHQVRYQRLVDQIEMAKAWTEQSNVQDPDLYLLIKAGQEIVNVRKRALDVHAKYKREAHFKKATNSLRDIILSDFISDAIFTAVEKVEGLLVYPYPMTTEWMLLDQAVSKMEISSRLQSTKMQVELVGMETFERGFNGNVVRALHSLDEFKVYPPEAEGVKILLDEMRNYCHSYRARMLELSGSRGSIKPSEVSYFLYLSCVVLVHLLQAELANSYENFNRDWLKKTNTGGVIYVPSLSSLCSNFQGKPYTVQDILRSAAQMKRIHPSVTIHILRLTQHVEHEITVLELSEGLAAGTVTGSVGHVRHDRISSISLSNALSRAIMFAIRDDSKEEEEFRDYKRYSVGVVSRKSTIWVARSSATFQSRGSASYSPFRSAARFRYSSRYTANQIAHIELTAGLREGCVQGGVGRVMYENISDDTLRTAIEKSEAHTAYRPDVIRLRHTCELICELRDAVAKRNCQKAFDLINDNIGNEGQTFKDLLSTIYSAEFTIHPSAVDEFTLIALETCESYWRFAAKGALIRGTVCGTRCCFQLSEVDCGGIDKVLGDIEGLIDISRPSIVIRELCFMVKHMRKNVINAMISHDIEEALYKKRKEPIPYASSVKLLSIMKMNFVEEAINNALIVVDTLSPAPYHVIVASNYAKYVTLENIANQVKGCILTIDEDNLVITHRNILLKECDLILEYAHFYTIVLTLERVLHMEGLWFSFSTSRLEIDSNIKSLLHQAVRDAAALKINATIPAEAMWQPLVEVGTTLWNLVELIDHSHNDIDKVNSDFFLAKTAPAAREFVRAVNVASSTHMFVVPPAILKQLDEVRTALLDHETYHQLLDIISNSSHFVVCEAVQGTGGDSLCKSVRLSESASRGNIRAAEKLVQDFAPRSVVCSIVNRLADFHLQMRNAIHEDLIYQARLYANAILEEESVGISFVEAPMVLRYCATMEAIRGLVHGLMCCILPPVPGWSDYPNASSIALSIVDYPLRQVLDSVVLASESTSECHIDLSDPKLVELVDLGRALVSLVCAVRRRTWINEELVEGKIAGERRESILREDMFTMLFPIDSTVAPANADSVLEIAYNDVFYFQESDISVKSAISRLKDLLLKSLFLSTSLRSYLEFTLESANTEQQIYDMSKSVHEALSRQQVVGIPGYLRCTQDSVDFVSATLRKLESELPVVESSVGLKRAYQSLKLSQFARLAVIKQNWEALGPIIRLYRFMASLDQIESSNECTTLMQAKILDHSELLRMDSQYFDREIDGRLDILKGGWKSGGGNVSTRPTGDQDLVEVAHSILGLESLESVLKSIPNIDEEMVLLEKHYQFETACHKFAVALKKTPAQGKPGEIEKSNIQYDTFYQVIDILRESGLLQFVSGERLYRSSSALISLRLAQYSGRLEDIKLSLRTCKGVLEEEKAESGKPDNSPRSRKYLSEAASEIDLASQDFVQQEITQALYREILSNRLPLNTDINVVDMSPSGEAEEATAPLSEAIRECMKRGITSKRGKKLLNTARLILNIRKNVLSRDWDELRALYDEMDIADKEMYDSVAIEEVEAAKRLLVVSSTIDTATDAISSNRIKGLVGDIDISTVSVDKLSRAKTEFGHVRSEWVSSSIVPYMLACNALIPIRTYALKEDWATVYDYACIELEKNTTISQLTPVAVMEILLARDHAAYVISRSVLIDSLLNGRMEGDVGEVDTSCIVSSTVEEAIRISQKMSVDHPDIQRLEASARIIFDIRRAQQSGRWMSDPSSRRRVVNGKEVQTLLPDPDTITVAMSLLPISGLKTPSDPSIASHTKLLQKYLSRNMAAVEQTTSNVSKDFGSIGWLMENSTVDVDSAHITEVLAASSLHCVDEVLEGAAYVERALGIADEAFPEIAFAREELKCRHIVHMLLSAVTSAGYKGVPGNLDGRALDLYPLERAILFAESNSDISDRGACRWILRDAKLLYQIRKSRSAKDWTELNSAVQEALVINTCSPPPLPELNLEGDEVYPEPIIPSIWNEISLIRADMLFYKCLSEFAQEMTNRTTRSSTKRVPGHKQETDSLMTLLQIILRSQIASEIYPSPEFERLIEAQRAALELRTHMTFDSTVSPRKIILNVGKIKDRDKRNGHMSYICFLMPDISQLSDVLDMEQLLETLEKAILKDQVYLRCPIGHIDINEIDLEYLRLAIQSAMPLLNVTGSKEHLSLLSLTTAMLAVRTEVVSQKWPRVIELIDSHESVLANHAELVKEEITRLLIEGENDEACRDMLKSLEQGRLTNVLALVKKISRHRSASMSAIPTSMNLDNLQWDSTYENQFVDIDFSIEKAIAIRHKSDTTSGLLRACVLIRALRSAIAVGDWDEVQQIVSEESNYTRMPPSSIEEIRAAKAALHYRNCMSTLSKGLITGAAEGVPGKINLSAVDCTTLQTAMSQAEVLDISDPATAIMLEIGHRICDIRQAVIASHWFTSDPTPESVRRYLDDHSHSDSDSSEPSDELYSRLRAYSTEDIRVGTTIPFSNACEVSDEDDEDDGSCNERSVVDSDVGISYIEKSMHGCSNESVESLLMDFKKRMNVLSDLRALLSMRTSDSNVSDHDGAADDQVSTAPDWVEHQLQAIKSVYQEVKLLENDLRERRRQELVVSALENIPRPVRQFGRMTPETDPLKDGVANNDEEAIPDTHDMFLIKPLEDAIHAAKSIDGEVPIETAKLITSAELILRFRRTMKAMDIECFKKLLDEANALSANNRLSIHYGVYELNAYRSATMTVTLAKVELVKALECGRVGGTLSRIDTNGIDIESLSFWVSSCSVLMESTRELSMGLSDALREAQIMLALRTHVKENNWESVAECLHKHSDQVYKFEFAYEEVQHIQYASKYRRVSTTISELVGEALPVAKEDQSAYILLKMNSLESALQTAEAVMRYQASLLQGTSDGADAQYTPELLEDPGHQGHNEFASLCYGAKSVLKLWKAIGSKDWKEESIAAGQVHLFPRPNDTLLNAVFEGVRQHEVAQRLGSVHDQLQFLKIDGEKKIRNIRQSIRASISLSSISGVNFRSPSASTKTPPMSKGQGNSPASSSRRSSAVVSTPSSASPLKGRRSSLSADASPITPPSHVPFQRRPMFETTPVSVLEESQSSQSDTESDDFSAVSEVPAIAPAPSRRRSMGMVSMLAATSASPPEKISTVTTKVRLGRASSQPPVSTEPVDSVAQVLCAQNWKLLPKFARHQFEQARNILIDRVIKLRLTWACSEGSAEEGKYGNISLINVDVELLNVALADVKRINFYTGQMMANFSFSKDVLAHIKVAKMLAAVRSCVIQNNIDGLLEELRKMNYLNSSRMLDVALSGFIQMERELELFERFAYECIAEKTVRNTVQFLCSVDNVRERTTSHPSIAALRALDKSVKPVGVATENYVHCAKVGSLLDQIIVASIMCNRFRVKRGEADILSLIQQPDSPLQDLKNEFLQVTAKLFDNAIIHAVDVGNEDEKWNSSFNAESTHMSSMATARRRSVIGGEGNAQSIKPLMRSTLGGFDEAKVEVGKGPPKTVASSMFGDFDSPADSDVSDISCDATALSSVRSLPDAILDIGRDAVAWKVGAEANVGTAFFAVNIEKIQRLECLYANADELFEQIFHVTKHGNIETVIDPMWILVGHIVLTSTRAANDLILHTNCDASDPGDMFLERLKALQTAGAALLSEQLVHECTINYLKSFTKNRSRPAIRIFDLSTYVDLLSFTLQRLDRESGRCNGSQRTAGAKIFKRLPQNSSHPASFMSPNTTGLCAAIDSFCQKISQEIGSISSMNMPSKSTFLSSEIAGVRRRCLSQAEGLRRRICSESLLLLKSDDTTVKYQKDIKAALSKRRRQFSS